MKSSESEAGLPAKPRPRGPRTWIFVCVGLALLGLLLVLAWFFVLPGLLRQRIAAALEDSGFLAVEVDAVDLATRSVTVRSLSLGQGSQLFVGKTKVGLSLGGLLAGRVDSVVVEEARLRLGAGDPLSGLRRPQVLPKDPTTAGEVTAETEASARTAAAWIDLPFETLVIERLAIERPLGAGLAAFVGEARIVIERATATSRVAALRVDIDGRLSARAASSAGAEAPSLRLHAHVHATPVDAVEGALRVSFEVDGDGGLDVEHGSQSMGCGIEGLAVEGSFDTSLPTPLSLRLEFAIPAEAPLVIRSHDGVTASIEGHLKGEVTDQVTLQWHDGRVAVGTVGGGGGREAAPAAAADLDALVLAGVGASLRFALTEATAYVPEVHWASLGSSLGQGFELGRGALVLRLPLRAGEAPKRVEVLSLNQATDMDPAASGWIRARNLVLEPGMERVVVDASLQRVVVQPWLDMVAKDRVSSDARVSGELRAVVAIEPRFRIRLDAGQLRATGPGRLSFAKDATTTAIIEPYVRAIAASALPGHEELFVERILGAVRDFRHEVLRLDIPDQPGDAVLVVRAKGRGVVVPQEIDATINIRGVQDLLDVAFDLRDLMDNAKRDAVDRAAIGPDRGKKAPK